MKHMYCSVWGIENERGSICMTEFTVSERWEPVGGYEAYCGNRYDREVDLVPPWRIRGRVCSRCLAAFVGVMRKIPEHTDIYDSMVDRDSSADLDSAEELEVIVREQIRTKLDL